MLLIQVENNIPVGRPVTVQNFKLLNPKVSFPKALTPDAVEPYGFGVYRKSSKPDLSLYEKAIEAAPQKASDGVWEQVWQVVTMTDAEASERDDKEANIVRSRRDGLLQETDWIVIKSYERGQNIPAEWELYRQALRDITAQAGFPYEVTWPTKP